VRNCIGNTDQPKGFFLTLLSPLFSITGNHSEKAFQIIWTEFERYFDLGRVLYKDCIAVYYEPNYSLQELQRIAQAVIYFEEAIDRETNIHPEDRPDHDPLLKKNWLQNPNFTNFLPRSISNAKRVLGVIGSTRTVEELIRLMNPQPVPEDAYSWCFEFEFERLLLDSADPIVFLGWPCFGSPVEAMERTNWTVSFITASMKCPELRQLTRFPPTQQGLSAFLSEGRSWARH
jgi:hypothetical protein